MTDDAADFGQEACGQFYPPLTNMLREHGIDDIDPQRYGFSGGWHAFSTGHEAIAYLPVPDEDIRRNVCLQTREIANDGDKTPIAQTC